MLFRYSCFRGFALLRLPLMLILQTESLPSSSLRVGNGYSVAFNHRHRRSGHLLQNHYQAVLCEEDCLLTGP
jgi:hypothetical protein